MKTGPTLFIESAGFAVEPGEERETNPGVLGRALACWIASRLREGGRAAGAPIAEDFGWCVPLDDAPFPLYVACANEEGVDGTWAAFVFAEPPFWKSLLRRFDTAPTIMRATEELRAALRNAPGLVRAWEEERA